MPRERLPMRKIRDVLRLHADMAVQDQEGAVAVLQVGRVDDDGEDQAEGVDQEMALLAPDLLARVIARRVDARPPFSALFTL